MGLWIWAICLCGSTVSIWLHKQSTNLAQKRNFCGLKKTKKKQQLENSAWDCATFGSVVTTAFSQLWHRIAGCSTRNQMNVSVCWQTVFCAVCEWRDAVWRQISRHSHRLWTVYPFITSVHLRQMSIASRGLEHRECSTGTTLWKPTISGTGVLILKPPKPKPQQCHFNGPHQTKALGRVRIKSTYRLQG